MENNKTRGYLPQECVSLILEIYNLQTAQRRALLNEIEVFGKINDIHIKTKRCAKCDYEFLNLNNEHFIFYINLILKFKRKNQRLVDTFFKAFSGFPYSIEEVKAHDLLWSERYECYYCKRIICYGCTFMCSTIDNKRFHCPMCNSISNIENYYQKIERMLNN